MVAALHLGIRHLPDRAGVTILPVDERLLAFNPAEEAGLVCPHVNRVGQDWTAFEPDDLLMIESPDFVPDFLDQRLSGRCMPGVPGCVGCDRAFDSDSVKGEIERSSAIATTVLVVEGSSASFVVDLRPVLVAVGFGPIRPSGWMLATRVADRIGRVSGEQNRALISHQT